MKPPSLVWLKVNADGACPLLPPLAVVTTSTIRMMATVTIPMMSCTRVVTLILMVDRTRNRAMPMKKNRIHSFGFKPSRSAARKPTPDMVIGTKQMKPKKYSHPAMKPASLPRLRLA